MRLLLDTHFVLWVSVEPSRVPFAAVELLQSRDVEPCFSVASIWEISIKAALGRREFQIDPAQLRASLIVSGYHELNISSVHAIAASKLPPIHRDPFDRMLVAQAITEDITLLTRDALLAKYPGPIRRI